MANKNRFIHIIILLILVPIPLILKTINIEETEGMFEMKSSRDEEIISTQSSDDTVLK